MWVSNAVSDLESVKTFAKEFIQSKFKLHVMINNAGVMACPLSLSKQVTLKRLESTLGNIQPSLGNTQSTLGNIQSTLRVMINNAGVMACSLLLSKQVTLE
jgi:short-subunit dehydrogenase involved in D-alanine esterification of teichoic acids